MHIQLFRYILMFAHGFQSQEPVFFSDRFIWTNNVTYRMKLYVESSTADIETGELMLKNFQEIVSRISISSLQEMCKRERASTWPVLSPFNPSLETHCKRAFAETRLPYSAAPSSAMTLIVVAYYSKTLIESWSHCKCDLTCCLTACSGITNKK